MTPPPPHHQDVMGCLSCDLLAGRSELPGGVIHDGQRWVVNHAVASSVLGALVLVPRRHVCAVADLDQSEATDLGPLLQRAAAVLKQLCTSQQVHVGVWSHGAEVRKHLHFVLQPITAEVVTRHPGLRNEALQAKVAADRETPPLVEVEAFCRRARAAFVGT